MFGLYLPKCSGSHFVVLCQCDETLSYMISMDTLAFFIRIVLIYIFALISAIYSVYGLNGVLFIISSWELNQTSASVSTSAFSINHKGL